MTSVCDGARQMPEPWNERVLLAIARPRAGGKDCIVAEGDRERIVMTER